MRELRSRLFFSHALNHFATGMDGIMGVPLSVTAHERVVVQEHPFDEEKLPSCTGEGRGARGTSS